MPYIHYSRISRVISSTDFSFVAKWGYDKRYLHCGFCPDLPCMELQQAFDHPEHGDHGERLANLKNWAKGDETILRPTTSY